MDKLGMARPLTRREFIAVLGVVAGTLALEPLPLLAAGDPRLGTPGVAAIRPAATQIAPYIGEIRMFAGNFAPGGWMLCQGQLLSTATYSALYAVLGTTYGGNGTTTFSLPDLRGRVPVHAGTGFPLGAQGGAETVALTVNQIPAHTHAPMGSDNGGSSNSPAGNVWANWTGSQFSDQGTTAGSNMNAAALASTGANQAHDNMLPYLAINFIIAVTGA